MQVYSLLPFLSKGLWATHNKVALNCCFRFFVVNFIVFFFCVCAWVENDGVIAVSSDVDVMIILMVLDYAFCSLAMSASEAGIGSASVSSATTLSAMILLSGRLLLLSGWSVVVVVVVAGMASSLVVSYNTRKITGHQRHGTRNMCNNTACRTNH